MRNKKIMFITYTAVFLALAAFFPALKLPQFITGPAVNFFLILATYTLGILAGVVIGCLTPWIAFLSGLMPVPFLPPLIMVGNGLYTLSFGLFKKYGWSGKIGGIIVGSILKYLFLSYGVRHFVKAPPKLVLMLSTPQLFTALTGGVLALIVIALLPKSIFPEDMLKTK